MTDTTNAPLYIGPAYTGADVQALISATYETQRDVFAPSVLDVQSGTTQRVNNFTEQTTSMSLQLSVVNNLAGVSISTHRSKAPVYNLGRRNPSGFVGSRRTTAGTLVFWLADTDPLTSLLSTPYQKELLRADEVPLFDLFLTFMNDQGSWSSCVIQGISIQDEGIVIDHSNPEGIPVTYSYLAMSATPIMPGYFSMLPKSGGQQGQQESNVAEVIQEHYERGYY